MKLTKQPYKACTNIYCVDCRELVAYTSGQLCCDTCEKHLGFISSEMETIIKIYDKITQKLHKMRKTDSKLLVKQSEQEEITEQVAHTYNSLAEELNALDESLHFQAWKDNRK